MSLRRLPGFRFETQPPALNEVLPRMDVAAFVGFATAGPLHTPVPVEDFAQFTAIFGDETSLAWDEQRGEAVHAQLAPSVRAFFRNGGRRCWIVRVAGNAAQRNAFPLPGLLQVTTMDPDSGERVLTPAFAQARSKGSGSDDLQVSATLNVQPVVINALCLAEHSVALSLTDAAGINIGDLLRLTFRQEGWVLMALVTSITTQGQILASPCGAEGQYMVCDEVLWFEMPVQESLPVYPSQVLAFSQHDSTPLALADQPLVVSQESARTEVSVTLALPLAAAPPLGALLQVTVAGRQLWLLVEQVSAATQPTSPLAEEVIVTGQGLFWHPQPPANLPTSSPRCERLSFDLWTRSPGDYPQRLGDLTFAPAHPRFWAALPTDEMLYQREETAAARTYTSLWQAAATPRWPLAGEEGAQSFYLPISMAILPELWSSAEASPLSPLVRDGLDNFAAHLFLDADLIENQLNTLIEQADFLRYQSQTPRLLTGIHAALAIDEITLIAVPDAIQRGWRVQTGEEAPSPIDSSPLVLPVWWHFLPCTPAPTLPSARTPQWENFLRCDLRLIEPPTLSVSGQESSTYTLLWTPVAGEPTEYILEESPTASFTPTRVVYRGTETRLTRYASDQGLRYYRVRALVGEQSSDWSHGIVVQRAERQRWQLQPIEEYSSDVLMAVQWALLRMCAARGDLFALLSLPEHYRADEAIAHVAALKSPFTPAIVVPLANGESKLLSPPGFGETRIFSYGAIYHPWLMERSQDRPVTFRRTPPDGAACGVIAQRSINRGAWIAPANEKLRDVVALTPPIASQQRLALLTAQVNLIWQEPAGFVAQSADTLSDDADLRPINVRRLLLLLRRLALRLGNRYVFEPNDAAFRRLVQRSFEALLEQMFIRGAFAGRTPESSFQVVTSNTLNTAQNVEQGRFIVELRVAPSLPLTFLTVRLVQTHDRTLVTE